jgi:diguanylate cyclase (GGDEF)-like protein
MRAADIVGRWGGEEFLLICGVEKADEAVRVAAKLRQAIEADELPQVGHVTASFGVYYASGQMEALERVTSRADSALYQAKEQGRNRVVLYQSTDRAAA